MHIDLNTISKYDFVEALLLSDDAEPFYLPREKQLASMDFDFEAMKEEFLDWMVEGNECEY